MIIQFRTYKENLFFFLLNSAYLVQYMSETVKKGYFAKTIAAIIIAEKILVTKYVFFVFFSFSHKGNELDDLKKIQ